MMSKYSGRVAMAGRTVRRGTAAGVVVRVRGRHRLGRAVAIAVAVPAVLVAVRMARAKRVPVCVRAAVTVNRPVDEVYRFWRNLENLPRFTYHLISVQTLDDRRSRWVAAGPAGRRVRWDAEGIAEEPQRLIAWRSLPGARVPNSGTVRFTPASAGRGTEVRVEMRYAPPAGRLGRGVAVLFGEEPQRQVADDLRRFKQVLETGGVVHSDASPEGIGARRQLLRRPARPPATAVTR